MNGPMTTALVLAVGLGALGILTASVQQRTLRDLKARRHVPSDEFAYLRGRYRRRMLTAIVLMVVGGLIAGAYLSGMERRADELGEPRAGVQPAADTPKPEMSDDEKRFVRFWGLYWIGVIVLVFLLFGLAITDAWASRRYWMG